MTGRRGRFALWVALAVAAAACMAAFPAFEHFIGGIRWEMGLLTGWALRDAWAKARRPR
jgi:hypothetical protein